eukprot:7359069-Alexandrium_andersonii.AAC.1
MSASLVGSEMCIRDRSEPAPPPGRRSSTRPPRSRAAPSTGGWGATPGAVSYTHLTLPTICSV